MASRRRRASASANTISANAARFRPPSRTTPGHSPAMRRNPSLPGALAALESSSVSITSAPNSAKSFATSLLPAPMPPVRPTFTAAGGDLLHGVGRDGRFGRLGGHFVDFGHHQAIDFLW